MIAGLLPIVGEISGLGRGKAGKLHQFENCGRFGKQKTGDR
jgi:hypothetical protein